MYCVSIALSFKGKVEHAVVYDPSRNDLFTATRGRGAYLNDRRIRVSKRIQLKDSLISTGFPFRRGDNFKQYMNMLGDVMQETAGVRRPAPPRWTWPTWQPALPMASLKAACRSGTWPPAACW